MTKFNNLLGYGVFTLPESGSDFDCKPNDATLHHGELFIIPSQIPIPISLSSTEVGLESGWEFESASMNVNRSFYTTDTNPLNLA